MATATEALYETFSAYGRPTAILTDGDTIVPSRYSILSKPLRELNGDDLKHYVFKAMTTAGTIDDFCYFLPRILQLATTNPQEWMGLEIVMGKLHYAKWQNWPQEQRSVVQQFCLAWLKEALGRFPSTIPVEQLVSALGCFDDLGPYLGVIRHLAEVKTDARFHVLDLMLQHLPDLLEYLPALPHFYHPAPFWSDRQENARLFTVWLCSDGVAALILRAHEEWRSQPDLESSSPVPLSSSEDYVSIYVSQRERLRAWAEQR